ncbi:MAG TPA: AMP-binding protein [Ktedonosporobacter sp.]|jgi:2,3-dihydroxybenzoate-AMP ligase|nr:AMP-binding protein [Ktedonosporobacter sp.]
MHESTARPLLDGFTPYPEEFVARYCALGYWESRSLAEFFRAVCNKFADRIALVARNERVTYRQLLRRAERLALHLLRLGIRPQDRIVVQLPNIPEFVYLYIALQMVGAIPILALPAHRESEIDQFVKIGDAVGYAIPEYVRDFDFAPLAREIQRKNNHLRFIFVAGQAILPGSLSLTDLLASDSGQDPQQLEQMRIEPLSPAVFLLSGGTTGIPKLIPRTHNDYIYNSKAAASVTDVRQDDALLVVLPIAHNFPLACPGVQGFLMQGARCVLSTSIKPSDVCSLIQKEKITHLALVPTLLIRLINDPCIHDYDFSSLRIINSGGQKLQQEVKQRTEELLPTCKVQEVFGMAEGLLCYVRLDDTDEQRYTTAGRPISPADEIRLVDDDGNDVAPGEVGELLVRGPYTLRGYFRVPEQNALSFTADGFYRTGDLMRQDSSGNYVVEGRKKDLINRGGEKISAEELENLLLAHPAVLNVACVPMPDPVLGERVCAFVIARPTMREPTLDDLTSFLLKKGIARFKLPERLEIVDVFPLSNFGKVSKKSLVQRLMALSGCQQ